MFPPPSHEEKMLVNNALVAFDLMQRDRREFVECGVDFHRLGSGKKFSFFKARGDDVCLIRKEELVDYARRCVREALSLATSNKRPFWNHESA